MTQEMIRGEILLDIPLPSSQMAKILHAALSPETESAPSDRAKTKIRVEQNRLVLEIVAEDLAALRAAINSFLSWVSSCLRAVESVIGQKS